MIVAARRKTKKRTLDAERYPEPEEGSAEAEEQPGSDDGIEDAEADEPFSERVHNFGERLRQARLRREEHEANTLQSERERWRRERDRSQRETVREATGPDRDERALLKLQMQYAHRKFTDNLRASGITSTGQSKPTQRKKLSDLHQAYTAMMVLECLKPLQRGGLSAQSVLSTVTMGTAMLLLSPNFRTQMGDFAEQMRTAIRDGLDKRATARIIAKGEKSLAKEAQHFAKTGRGREDMRGLSGMRHRRRMERVERMNRGDRDLYTEHSAALTHVGIAQNAYDEMRKPGADRELIKRNYQSALSVLYGHVDDDGVDRQAVAGNMRIIVGQLIEREPEQAAVFAELGHGRFTKTEPQTVILEGTTQERKAWTGDYVDTYNGDVISGGTFALREPMGTDDHRAAVARTMYGELTSAPSPVGFGEVLEQYVVGSITREYPQTVELTESAAARARLNRSRAMFASMRDDRLNDQDQKLVYMGGFLEALEAAQQTHPQMVAQWRQGPGPRRLRDLVEKYRDFGEQAARDRRGEGARVWVEPEQDSPWPEGADIADAGLANDEPESGQGSSSPGTGATPQPPATGPAGALGEAVMYERGELCRRVGLVDEHGNVDEKRLREMEAKGVSLGRAARTQGDWFINDAALTRAEGETRHVMLVEAISEHIANDVLSAVRSSDGKNAGQTIWPVVRVWRNRARALGPLTAEPGGANPGLQLPSPWGQDEASNTRAREMGGMSVSMKNFSLAEQDRIHSLAYVRALEKMAAAEPPCEKFIHHLVAYHGGDPRNWRQHEYKAALDRAYSGPHQRTYSQECTRLRLEPIVKDSSPGSDTERLQAEAMLPVIAFTDRPAVTPGILARNRQKVLENQGANGVQTGQPVSSTPLVDNPGPDNEPELGG
jgi:hypothetical protein